ASHQGRPHALVFAYRYPAGEDEPFGAATDGSKQGTDPHLASLGRINRLLAHLGPAGGHIPERLALHLGSCLWFLRKISGAWVFTLARFASSTALDLNARRYIVKTARKSTQSPRTCLNVPLATS